MTAKLLLATGNAAKQQEYFQLLEGIPFQLTTPARENIKLVVAETGTTLEENARLKAVAYTVVSGLLTLADDSGLEVVVLGGAPGVLSARYAGDNASDADKVSYLLSQLSGVPMAERLAHFRCIIAIAHPTDKMELCEGVCCGLITLEPRGEHGFGYDPIFYLPKLGKTMAELTMDEKNKLSHRGIAARKARAILESYISPCLPGGVM